MRGKKIADNISHLEMSLHKGNRLGMVSHSG